MDRYLRAVPPPAGCVLRNGWREVGDFLGPSIRDFWGPVSAGPQLEWRRAGLRGVGEKPNVDDLLVRSGRSG